MPRGHRRHRSREAQLRPAAGADLGGGAGEGPEGGGTGAGERGGSGTFGGGNDLCRSKKSRKKPKREGRQFSFFPRFGGPQFFSSFVEHGSSFFSAKLDFAAFESTSGT